MTNNSITPLYKQTYKLFGKDIDCNNLSNYLDILVKYGVIPPYLYSDHENYMNWTFDYSQKFNGIFGHDIKIIKYWKDDINEWQLNLKNVDTIFDKYPHLLNYSKKINGIHFFTTKFLQDILEPALNDFNYRFYDKLIIKFDMRDIPFIYEDLITYDTSSYENDDIDGKDIIKEDITIKKEDIIVKNDIIIKEDITIKKEDIIVKNNTIKEDIIVKNNTIKEDIIKQKIYNITINEDTLIETDAKFEYIYRNDNNNIKITFNYKKEDYNKLSNAIDKCIYILYDVINEIK